MTVTWIWVDGPRSTAELCESATLAVEQAPRTAASYPWIVAGIALHLGYQLVLTGSYRTGDLTQVYPMARGSAPLMVALISVVFLGVVLDLSFINKN